MTVYFAGGEDHDHFENGGGTVNTTTSNFRSAYARCALLLSTPLTMFWQNWQAYASTPTSFWFSARLNFTATLTINTFLLKFLDNANFPRLQIKCSTGGALGTNVMIVQKVNTAGTATTLTNTLATWSLGPSGTPDKLDIHWVNAVSGSIDIWFNGIRVFNYVGDTTTETTTIGYHQLMSLVSNCLWSEIIVADSNTLSASLQTLQPVANGNTHNFDTGSPAAANVNETTLSDATLDGSTTNGQIDQYTIPALATGTLAIVAIGISARMQKGASGPSKMDLGFHISSSDFWSSDQVLTASWANYQNWWTTDPNTSAAWAALPTNIGLKAVT